MLEKALCFPFDNKLLFVTIFVGKVKECQRSDLIDPIQDSEKQSEKGLKIKLKEKQDSCKSFCLWFGRLRQL